MPNEPVISIQELARSCTVGSNQRRKPVSGAIRQALTPTPHSTRAASRPEKLVASENAQQPATATARKPRITFLGPWRSSQVPSGSWMRREAEEVAAGQQAQVARAAARTPASAWATAWP